MASKINLFYPKLFFILLALLISYDAPAQEVNKETQIDNKMLQSIDSQYHPKVIGLSKNGLVEGREAMKLFLVDFDKKQGSTVNFKTLYQVPVYQKLEYEIGLSETAKGGQFAHIIIWLKENDAKQKIADVAFEKTSEIEVPAELANAREKWMKLCASKNAKKLVSELYTNDAIYYNRGRILIGHDQLSKEYSYMNDPSYSLKLSPKHIEMVAEDLIYEIGMCSGSYNLPYILVWKKQQDGNWKIYMDSNY